MMYDILNNALTYLTVPMITVKASYLVRNAHGGKNCIRVQPHAQFQPRLSYITQIYLLVTAVHFRYIAVIFFI